MSPPDACLDWAKTHERPLIEFIRKLVECESPSDSPCAVNRFAELFCELTEALVPGLVQFERVPAKGFGDHLLCRFRFPGAEDSSQVMALGHSDTVWSMGTLARMPYRESEGRLWGPGVLDMKAGLAFFVFAMKAVRDLQAPAISNFLLQVNSDEEVGSHSSRELTETNARRSKAVLVLEPGTGLEGKAKTARKGIGDYRLTVRGVAAHAGVDFEKGASANVEMARQMNTIASFVDLARGVTVNPGVMRGGTRSNVVADEAFAHIDIRVPTLGDFESLDRKFRSLRPFNNRCSIELTGGLNRPPMERSEGGIRLFELAQRCARDAGVHLEESSTGGGSDGNFTAALGVPTIDGLGAVGEGAHALRESILVDRIADRVALLAKLSSAIS